MRRGIRVDYMSRQAVERKQVSLGASWDAHGVPRLVWCNCANRDTRAVRCSKPHAQRGQSKTHLQHFDLTPNHKAADRVQIAQPAARDCITIVRLPWRIPLRNVAARRPETRRLVAKKRRATTTYVEDRALNVRRKRGIFISKTLGCDLQVRMRVTRSQIGAWSLRVGERSAEAGARKVRTVRHPAFITEPPRHSSACGLVHHPLPHGVFGSNWYGMMA
ncbi:hypothetical protein BKA58DRAFT_152882 [Alternaria rosae]|uniref:uncharacterized protein n=1 Tax=Alternaria rosae TaxID=1187941 RepID=UPI001E8DB80C|nr:uncharacterized protein BKA58DRAFT_152882 [Alternaria rosae]KAH6872801.1 hypothetical protein BKA58DRAFT_152882 [Alternaria rosae]